MDFLAKLNPEQREAVLHRDGPLLILAGAGSGKTRVITFRIAHLIGDGHAEPGQVLAVTFTNKAARRDARARRGADRRRRRRACGSRRSTRSARGCCGARRRRSACRATSSSTTPPTRSRVVKQIEKELGIDDKFVPPRQALSRISHATNRMEGPESLRGACNIRDEQIAKIFERYVAALRDSNALDFDDLLLKTVELFETSEQAREFYARKFRYVMVDEYQDTNRPQYMLIRRLAEVAPQPRGRRRSGSVDLQVARRRPAQHPRLRARLPRGADRPARAELPLDAGHPRRRQRRHPARTATARTSGCGPTARAARSIVSYRGNDELEEADFIVRTIKQARAERRRHARSPSSTASTRSRGRLKTR